MRLKEILGDEGSYYTYPGEPKDCGPFYPDFAVEWTDGKARHRMLICFSCGEARTVSKNKEDNFDLRRISDLKSISNEFSCKRLAG